MFNDALPYFFLSFALWGLGFIISALVLYLIVRLAVTAALKTHTRWMNNGQP